MPAFLLLIAMIIGAGRIALAHQAVEAAAADAARSASIARTQSQANADASAAATANLANRRAMLLQPGHLDTSGFAAPVGTPASSRDLDLRRDPSESRSPGCQDRTIRVTMTSPIDSYREG